MQHAGDAFAGDTGVLEGFEELHEMSPVQFGCRKRRPVTRRLGQSLAKRGKVFERQAQNFRKEAPKAALKTISVESGMPLNKGYVLASRPQGVACVVNL